MSKPQVELNSIRQLRTPAALEWTLCQDYHGTRLFYQHPGAFYAGSKPEHNPWVGAKHVFEDPYPHLV